MKFVLCASFEERDIDYIKSDIREYHLKKWLNNSCYTLWVYKNTLFIKGNDLISFKLNEDNGNLSILDKHDRWDTMCCPTKIEINIIN